MSNKVHMKILGVDCRDQGQTEEEYNNQALCGFAGVSVSRSLKEIDCKLCVSKIKSEKGIKT